MSTQLEAQGHLAERDGIFYLLAGSTLGRGTDFTGGTTVNEGAMALGNWEETRDRLLAGDYSRVGPDIHNSLASVHSREDLVALLGAPQHDGILVALLLPAIRSDHISGDGVDQDDAIGAHALARTVPGVWMDIDRTPPAARAVGNIAVENDETDTIGHDAVGKSHPRPIFDDTDIVHVRVATGDVNGDGRAAFHSQTQPHADGLVGNSSDDLLIAGTMVRDGTSNRIPLGNAAADPDDGPSTLLHHTGDLATAGDGRIIDPGDAINFASPHGQGGHENDSLVAPHSQPHEFAHNLHMPDPADSLPEHDAGDIGHIHHLDV